MDGGRFVTTTNANTTQLMGFVAMTAPHSPTVSHQHTDVCVFVWQSLLWRVCLVVSIWQVCLAVHNSHMVCLVAVGRMHHNRCCFLLLPVLLCGQGILCVLHHTCLCLCVERFGFGNKQAHKHTTCGNTTRVGAPGQLATQPATSALVPSPR